MKTSLFNKNRKESIELNTNLKDIEITDSIRNYKFNKTEIINNNNIKSSRVSYKSSSINKQNRSVAVTEFYENKLNHTEIETTNNQYMQTFQLELNPYYDNEISLILMQFLRTYYPLFCKHHYKRKFIENYTNNIYHQSQNIKTIMKIYKEYFIPCENFMMNKNVFSLKVEEIQNYLSDFYNKIEKVELEEIRILKFFNYILDFIHLNYYLHDKLDDCYNNIKKRKKYSSIFKNKYLVNSSKLILLKNKKRNIENLIKLVKELNNIKNKITENNIKIDDLINNKNQILKNYSFSRKVNIFNNLFNEFKTIQENNLNINNNNDNNIIGKNKELDFNLSNIENEMKNKNDSKNKYNENEKLNERIIDNCIVEEKQNEKKDEQINQINEEKQKQEMYNLKDINENKKEKNIRNIN